jgi:hypothetical protein
MTVLTIINRAARVNQEVNEGQRAPVAWVANEVALNGFNDLMRDMRGVQIGQRLARVWDAAAGDVALPGGIYNCNVYAPEEPWNGDRFRVLGARTVTVSDDTIESASSVTTTVSTSWMYREDQGNWQREQALDLDDESPLQEECDEALAILVAARIQLEQMGELSAQMSALASQARNRIRQLYQSRTSVAAEAPVLRGLAHRGGR